MDMRFEKLNDLFKDAEVAQKLLACTAEEAVVILKDQYDLEFTVDELNEVAAGIKAALTANTSDELSCEQLEEVVGGGNSAAYNAGYYIGKTVIAGCVIIGGIAAAASLGW